jgi:hypothetical protein
MTIYETAQLELAAVLFTVTGVAMVFLSRWLIRRHRWPAFETLLAAFLLTLGAVAYGLAGEPTKETLPPQVRQWIRFKKDWAKWTHTVKLEWAEFCAAIRQGFISVHGLYGEVLNITNSIPEEITRPKAMQLRVNLLDNPSNQNFKARPTKLTDNGDGTWTVAITASREIVDEPALMMYLRRKSDGKMWWVEHASSTFPSNTAPNTFSYTFEMPETLDANLIVVSDEVLLGGPQGLTVEGLALVDLDKGEIYEGIDGDFIDGEGRALQVRGGRLMFDSAKSQSAGDPAPEPMIMGGKQADPEPLLTAKGTAATAAHPTLRGGGMLRDTVVLLEPEPAIKPGPAKIEPPLKLSMPPLDGGAK